MCWGSPLENTTSGSVLSGNSIKQVRAIRHGLYATPLSTTGFYDGGVVQSMASKPTSSHFGSTDKLQRIYFLGDTGAIDIQRISATGGEDDQTVMLNAAVGGAQSYVSGLQDILVGSFQTRDRWCNGSNSNDITV